MKESNLGDVGQIRRRNGTSMKRIMNAEALTQVRSCNCWPGQEFNSHAETTEDNQDRIKGEDVGNSKRKTEDDAQYTGPRYLVRFIPVYDEPMFDGSN
jgi:hypothetical protein